MSRAAPSPLVRTRRARSRPGFSLAEMAVSMVIIGVVCGATLSVTTLLARSASASADTAPAGQTAAARDALDQITRELKGATSVTEQTASAITFTVPDRTGDGVPETIRYAWAGAGQPLTRSYNGAAAVTVMTSVQTFDLGYATRTVAIPMPPTQVESAEQTLYSYDSVLSLTAFSLKTSTWAGQYFNPTLGGTAISWKMTRVRVQLRHPSGADQTYSINIMAADGSNKPTGTPLATLALDTSTLPSSWTWVEFKLPTPVAGLSPGTGCCIVVKQTGGGVGNSAVDVVYNAAAASDATRGWSTTTNSGGSWSAISKTKSMQFYVFGTVTSLN